MKKNAIRKLLADGIRTGKFPSCSYLIAEKGEIRLQDALGNAVVRPEQIAARASTIYDLASLTKPLVTGLLMALLIERGEITLDHTLYDFHPGLADVVKREITIRDLVTHTSGLRAWRPFYLFKVDPEPRIDVLRQIFAEPFECPRGSLVVYSDLNFLLLQSIIEDICSAPLENVAKASIFEPLGLSDTFFNPPETLRVRIAASEKGNKYEKQMCRKMFSEAPLTEKDFRKELIWGEVHDANCFYLGGIAGHAGLFSTAAETGVLAGQFLPETSTILNADTCRLFSENMTPGLNQARSFGFQLASTPDCSAGPALSPDSFGHLGFTGTSLWVDGKKGRIFVLLTNRTHDSDPPFPDLAPTRKAFNSAAAGFLEKG